MKTKSLAKAVLFDLDGTLVEFKFDVVAAKKAMISWLKLNGFESGELSEELKSQQIMDIAEVLLRESDELKSKWKFDHVRTELSRLLEEFEFRGFESALIMPGSREILTKLRLSGTKTGIVTNSGRRPVDYALKKFGFGVLLDIVLTRSEIPRLKPYPDGLLSAVEKLGLDGKDQAVYVGDSVIDIEAARNAGIQSIAFCGGMYQELKLTDANPDFLIHELSGLEEIVLP